MLMRMVALLLLIQTFGSQVTARQETESSDYLGTQAPRLMQEAKATGSGNSMDVYQGFARLVVDELKKRGKQEIANHITAGQSGQKLEGKSLATYAWLTRTFAREFYKDDIISATSDLIKFKTFATDVPNRQNPEFIKQKQYLAMLASRLGLGFRDVDGYVQEIWIGDEERSLGIMVHSDVQPVDTTAWSVNPWGGELKSGALWGRGAIDDKGPLAAIMYGMRAVLDSRIPLRRKLILLVGTDEESANEDVSTYLKTNPAPDQTIVVDYGYPVICAEKGWCGVWLKLPKPGAEPDSNGLVIESLDAGFSPSIVPGKATAMLRASGNQDLVESRTGLLDAIVGFEKQRVGSRFDLSETDGGLSITAHGRTVHSSVPATGHNALMDLIVFLDQNLKPAKNSISLMVKFAAQFVGLELDGRSLGIAHHDDFMGDVTVAGNMFHTEADSVMFMFNFRIPRGISLETVRQSVAARKTDFEQQHEVRFSEASYYSEALYNDPDGPFVRRLLRIYNSVTGENRVAESMGGGTYAKRLPNSVVFGPKLVGEEYLGHQPDEHVSLETLTRNIEILTHTLAEFAFQAE